MHKYRVHISNSTFKVFQLLEISFLVSKVNRNNGNFSFKFNYYRIC